MDRPVSEVACRELHRKEAGSNATHKPVSLSSPSTSDTQDVPGVGSAPPLPWASTEVEVVGASGAAAGLIEELLGLLGQVRAGVRVTGGVGLGVGDAAIGLAQDMFLR